MMLIEAAGICCCCLSCIGLNDMLLEHIIMFECFKMDLQTEGCSDKYSICEGCIVKLKDAFRFRLQISAAQESIKNGFRSLNNSKHDIVSQIKEEIVLCSGNAEEICDNYNAYANVDIKAEPLNLNENIRNFTNSLRNNVDINDENFNTKKEELLENSTKTNIEFVSCEPSIELKGCISSDIEDDITLEKYRKKYKLNSKGDENQNTNERNETRHVFKCDKCSENFTSFHKRLTHLYKVHDVDVYRYHCDHCSKRFRIRSKLREHINFAHLKSRKFVCDVCKKDFIDKKALRVHIETHKYKANNVIRSTEVDKTYRCNVCKNDFDAPAALKEHFHIHYASEENASKKKYNLYCCAICRETFTSFLKRITHMAEVHGEDVYKHWCSYCPKKFRVNSKLREHIDFAHLKSRKHVCDVCDKDFIDNKALRIHKVTHTGVKNFQCRICEKFFATLASLCQHKKIHNNIKNFVCHICAKAFTQSGTLWSHMRRHEKKQKLLRC